MREPSSPEIDFLLDSARCDRGAGRLTSSSQRLWRQVWGLTAALDRVVSEENGQDRRWSLWLRTPRGEPRDFGNFEDLRDAGEVATYEEFMELWRLEYPDEVQWHRVGVVSVGTQLHLSFRDECVFAIHLDRDLFVGVDVTDEDTHTLVEWLLAAIYRETRRFLGDPEAYNREVAKHLPLSRRFGRIGRRELWGGAPGFRRYDHELGKERLARLAEIVATTDDTAMVRAMSLSRYLEYCAICWAANEYDPIRPGMSPIEMYHVMADGRHEGLIDLPLPDPEAFSNWFHNRTRGGHPWEICRGGNRTHISLYVVERPAGWQLVLSGFSDARAVETARMAVALHEQQRPFVLDRGRELLRMVRGEDEVGIVPEDLPLYAPAEDFVAPEPLHSFVRLADIQADGETLLGRIRWAPPPELTAR